ncbi:hypothetical protein IM774_07715 [Erysipelotrichaceae bacterium RD49]|nr:hypothetical protein [Erysipelotrichaceae bacterium RD49]
MGLFKMIQELLEQFNEDLDEKSRANDLLKQIQEEGFKRGVESLKDKAIVALEPGTVQTIDQSPNQIQIFMNEGQGYLINNDLMPLASSIKVKPDQEVKEGQILIALDNADSLGLEVFAYTNEMLTKLNSIREMLSLGLPSAIGQ